MVRRKVVQLGELNLGGDVHFFSETNMFLPFFMSKCGGSEEAPPHLDIKNGRKILVSEKNGRHPLDSARRAEQLSF